MYHTFPHCMREVEFRIPIVRGRIRFSDCVWPQVGQLGSGSVRTKSKSVWPESMLVTTTQTASQGRGSTRIFGGICQIFRLFALSLGPWHTDATFVSPNFPQVCGESVSFKWDDMDMKTWVATPSQSSHSQTEDRKKSLGRYSEEQTQNKQNVWNRKVLATGVPTGFYEMWVRFHPGVQRDI